MVNLSQGINTFLAYQYLIVLAFHPIFLNLIVHIFIYFPLNFLACGAQRIHEIKKKIYIYIYIFFFVGPKDLGIPAHFISSSRPMPKRKKCPRTNKENPNCQDILSRTTLSSADQNHRREKCHAARGSPFEHPKGSSEPSGPAIGAW